ncbi:MAG: aminotransferase class I/II-fold pyridoxal phosphate-dependent enzyme [Clostridia bacterium]|nr:aminotransferase class I/II-fold pyridoxal phosphate-dependent enzyme [Clostridia bacterium]
MKNLSKQELYEVKSELEAKYNRYKSLGLKLDMSRGNPCKEQLDISEPMLSVLKTGEDCIDAFGFDCRNYGILDGIPEAKALFAELMNTASTDEIIIGGNSSLNMMYDNIVRAMIFGVYGGEQPWSKCDKIKFICPVPGYDRHFKICESLGIEMISVPLLPDGPDMDMVEKLVSEDESIKGMWCVPKYSNPSGVTYSNETVLRFAKLKPKAKDFRVFWDNAYSLHDISDRRDILLNVLEEAKKYGNGDMIYKFMSTSKVSFPGAGVAAMAASKNNINFIKKLMGVQTIGHDKLNQLRHVRYFKDAEGVREQMHRHAEIIKPRFAVLIYILEKEIPDVATWSNPNGGYFVSLTVPDGCAKRVVSLMKEAGVTMTPAGSTFPYGVDPKDNNIRIAPTNPPLAELQTAAEILCVCVRLAAVEKYLSEKE